MFLRACFKTHITRRSARLRSTFCGAPILFSGSRRPNSLTLLRSLRIMNLLRIPIRPATRLQRDGGTLRELLQSPLGNGCEQVACSHLLPISRDRWQMAVHEAVDHETNGRITQNFSELQARTELAYVFQASGIGGSCGLGVAESKADTTF